jgi:MATE family multidrug resistance protein
VGLVWKADLLRGAWTPWSRAAFDGPALRHIIGLGLPIALQMGLEVWAFSAATLLAGRLGASAVAAHTIVLNLASFSFMMPLGVAQAACTRVGNLVGAKRFAEADRAAWVAIGLGAAVMACWALLFVTLRGLLPCLYTPDAAVISLAAGILPIAGAFQIFDGVQVVASGVLRGMSNTRPAALLNFTGYWLVALPLAAFLTARTSTGLEGIWWSLCLGLFLVAAGLVVFVRARGPHHLGSAASAR